MVYGLFQPNQKNFVKHVLVMFAIILTLIPVVKAEEKSWYEIDGIRFRYVTNSPEDCEFKSPVSCSKNPIGIYMPWKLEDRISPYFSDAPKNAAAIAVKNIQKPLFPLAIELPETLMTSWLFRGALFEFEFPTEVKDLRPMSLDDERSRDDSYRTSLYNDFFNASDKSFADANSNWEMSADVTSSRIFLGYTMGFFIPIGDYHRFLKFGAGLGVYYIDLSFKLNLCSRYEERDKGEVECVGKTEIDSYSGKKLGVASASFMTFWERRTKDSIWRFLQVSGSTALGSNDKGYLRAKLKNHSKSLALFISSETWEIITYTYRF